MRVKSFFHRLNLWLDHFAKIKQQQPWTIKLHTKNITFLDKEPVYAPCLGTARENKKGGQEKGNKSRETLEYILCPQGGGPATNT